MFQFISNLNVKAQLRDIDLTIEKQDDLILYFLKDFKEHKLEYNGWPMLVSAYKILKATVNAYTRILARKYPKFCINCVHFGFVKIDITLNTGVFMHEEAARGPVMLALLLDGGPSGSFFNQT
ncbi:hypothetical protein GIB67_009206 [Kingdonia uniflora]|uniref:Uncharacterized protein n=1 Tax=Kingdonia uniflora TaxID=39325 RepID=A0A7J7N296_9MAGN|nr:hypothetical protein GIB67_009206 [Kingdonia uniflora]